MSTRTPQPQEPPAAAESFVSHANRLDHAGHRNAAMDLLYDRIDEMMRMGQFDALDAELRRVPVHDMSVDVLLALLTATLPDRNRLQSRPGFATEVERTLRERGEYEDGF